MQPIECVNMLSLVWKNIKAKWRLSGKRRHVGKEVRLSLIYQVYANAGKESHEMFISTIVLRWEGVGLYKIFESRFYVVQGDSLTWQIILGAKTCATHNLLTAGAFGGSKRQVFYKKEKSKEMMKTQ